MNVYKPLLMLLPVLGSFLLAAPSLGTEATPEPKLFAVSPNCVSQAEVLDALQASGERYRWQIASKDDNRLVIKLKQSEVTFIPLQGRVTYLDKTLKYFPGNRVPPTLGEMPSRWLRNLQNDFYKQMDAKKCPASMTTATNKTDGNSKQR